VPARVGEKGCQDFLAFVAGKMLAVNGDRPNIVWKEMVPSVLNKVCAHPMVVTWVLGACALHGVIYVSVWREVPVSALVSDWQAILLLVLAIIAATLLGFFVGMFTCWPLVRIICSRYNAAPLQAGDQVMILSGPEKGKIAEVYEITKGQGGWNLAKLDLGQERAERFRDIFEEYSLFKLKGGHPSP